MEKDTLRMQFLSGVITEGQYKIKLHENVAVAEVRRAMEAAIAKIKNPTDIERRINNVKFVVYNSLDPNTNGGERPPSDFQFDDAWWDSTHSQATDSVIASIYGELDAAVKGKSFGEDPMNENKSLNESMIGGIVGIGAINQIPPRAKADYETAFEHFLGKKYGLNEEMEVMVDSNMLKSYFNELISLADDMEYTPEMVDELKNLKNTLQGGKISVENALDLMQQTVDITEDDIDAVEALSQAVDNDDAIIDKAREIYGLDEGKEVKEDFKFGGKHGLTMAGDEPTPVKVNKGNKELGGIASTMEDVFQAFNKEVQQKYPDIFQDKKLLSRIEMMAQQIKRLKNEVKVEEIKEVEEKNNY